MFRIQKSKNSFYREWKMQHQDPTRHWTSELGIPKVKQGTEKRKHSLETMKSVLLYYNYIHPII